MILKGLKLNPVTKKEIFIKYITHFLMGKGYFKEIKEKAYNQKKKQ